MLQSMGAIPFVVSINLDGEVAIFIQNYHYQDIGIEYLEELIKLLVSLGHE